MLPPIGSPFGRNRREAIRVLAGAAALPAFRSAAEPRRRIGIIGGGMAGVSLAWLLDGAVDVVLLEGRDSLGGNVQSVEVDLDGQVFPVDIGAQFFHPGPYPTYVKLLTYLGLYPPSTLESRAFTASITVDSKGEPLPRFVSPVIPGRIWPLLAPWNLAGIGAFAVGFGAAKKREEQGEDWELTLGAWLQTLALSRPQWEGMLLPWAASLFSGDIEQARQLSARVAMIFAAKALPENLLSPLLYYVLSRGMVVALDRMAAQLSTVQVQTRAWVSHVQRKPPGGFRIFCADGRRELVDDLVFASSGPATLRLLEGLSGTRLQQAALRGIEFHDARLVLHTDPIYAPPNPIHWSFLNCRLQGAFCEATMWMADLLPVQRKTAAKIWKSWVSHRSQEPAQILHESSFKHLLPTPGSIASQTALLRLQGLDGIWFTGGYTLPYDSQETALLSSLNVAPSLAGPTNRAQRLLADG